MDRENQLKLDRPTYSKRCQNPRYCLTCAHELYNAKGIFWGAKIAECKPKRPIRLFFKSPPEPKLHTAENYTEIINEAIQFIKTRTKARGALLNLHVGIRGDNIHVDAILIDAGNFNHVSKYFNGMPDKQIARTDEDYRQVARYCLKYPILDYYRKPNASPDDRNKLTPFPIDEKLIKINTEIEKIKPYRALGCLHHRAK